MRKIWLLATLGAALMATPAMANPPSAAEVSAFLDKLYADEAPARKNVNECHEAAYPASTESANSGSFFCDGVVWGIWTLGLSMKTFCANKPSVTKALETVVFYLDSHTDDNRDLPTVVFSVLSEAFPCPSTTR